MSTRQRPNYAYDVATGRYRDLSTGRFVSEEFVFEVMQARIDEGFDRMDSILSAMLADDTDVSLADWQLAMATELRNMHYQMTLLGSGGVANTTQADYGRLGFTLKEEYGYLQNFANEIAAGNLSEGQIRVRMQMYADKIWNSFWVAKTTHMKEDAKATHEARELDPFAEHCTTHGGKEGCVELAAKGIQPIGTLPNPADGSTPCLSNDKCRKVYYRKVGTQYQGIA